MIIIVILILIIISFYLLNILDKNALIKLKLSLLCKDGKNIGSYCRVKNVKMVRVCRCAKKVKKGKKIGSFLGVHKFCSK